MPSTVLHLHSGRLAFKNIRFLIADDAVSCEDLLIGRPVLRHLRVDTRTLLEDRVRTVDGTDCSTDFVGTSTGGRVSRLMLARLSRVEDDHVDLPTDIDPTSPKVKY